MTPSFSFTFRPKFLRRLSAALGLALLAAGGTAYAAEPPSLSEKASETFTKIAPFLKDNKWDEALAALNSLIPQLPKDSYDMAEILQTKGKILLQKEDYTNALEPLETSLKISDAKGFFDKSQTLMLVDLIARLYSQEATAQSKTPALQQQYFAKAASYFKRWLAETPKPNADAELFYASVLVNQASANPEKIDLPLVKEARAEVEKALLLTNKPKESMYQLLYFALQQEGDIQKSAEILELLVKAYPTKLNYWQQLMGTYNTLAAQNEKNEAVQKEYYIRTINTIERAQAYGLLKSPKDQYNLVTIYSLAGQFGRSTELLYAGLKNGTIESDVKNWLLLAYAYQQVNQDLQAASVLKEAINLFPKSAQLEFQLGQIYTSLDDTKNANIHYKSAVQKGGGDKPAVAAMYVAWTSFELGQLDDALDAITKAEKYPESAKDKQLPQLKKAILNSLEERKNNAESKAAETKKV